MFRPADLQMRPITLHAISGLDEIVAAADLGALLSGCLKGAGFALTRGDIIVVAQKVVSKAEDRFCDLRSVSPSARARALAEETRKDPRLVEVILGESSEVVRAKPGVLIMRHRLGFVMAQAGVDQSNVPGSEQVLLLPRDPDQSARRIRDTIQQLVGVSVGVIVSDSFGRPWRVGTTNVAIGAAGVTTLWDRRGEKDRHGRLLEVTQVAWADAVAAAAGLIMGEGAEGIPAVLVRGLAGPDRDESPASALVRPLEQDLFR